RNPWRISFDPDRGDLFIADVGQNSLEEINVQDAGSGGGENYGWNIMEGSECFAADPCSQSGLTLPVAQYSHSLGCSVTGGEVYRGIDYPDLQGLYLYGDFCSGRIWGLGRQGSGWSSELLVDSAFNILTFGRDESGNIYLSDGNAVYLVSDGPPAGNPGFQVSEWLNDAWVRDGAPFQGLFITVFPVLEQVFVAWFSFDSMPAGDGSAEFGASDQRWVTAIGPYAGNEATLQAELTTGGRFNSAQPLATQDGAYGALDIVFEDCNHATLTYDFPGAGLSGSFDISRALNSNIAMCKANATDPAPGAEQALSAPRPAGRP
ncbi:MAG: PQQ-dependent sugar dehydrogenase, partial [Gammaproteobacteria bacterium]|nr:PQQ-dependent sugar dehydrogenase [Gammaproteobacteria bacterium]